MKRYIVTILAIIYLGSSTGATFHMHYCMGKLVDVGLWHGEAKTCSNCGMKKNTSCAKKCCRDEHKTVKLEKDQQAANATPAFMQCESMAAPVAYIELPGVHTVPLVEMYPISNAPPRSSKIHPHLLHCTFRI